VKRVAFSLVLILMLGLVGTANSAGKKRAPTLVTQTFVCANTGCCPCSGRGITVGGGGTCPEGTSIISSEKIAGGDQWCITCGSHLELGGPDTVGDCVNLAHAIEDPENFVCLLNDGGPIPTETQVMCAYVND